jgi:hypothetical protein
MTTYKVTGNVLNRETSEGVPGLRVEAWDKDLLVNDLVGAATTNRYGVFRIQFDETYFKELFLDRRPDLFFKVFREGALIASTEDNVLWNEANADVEVNIEVDNGASQGATDAEQLDPQAPSRNILQATYTPKRSDANQSPSARTRGLEKAAFIARLKPTLTELDGLAAQFNASPEEGGNAALERVVNLLRDALNTESRINPVTTAKAFATLDSTSLAQVARALVELRHGAVDTPRRRRSGQDAEQLTAWRRVVDGFIHSMEIEPVGYLHLEKLSFLPAGIERGELVYTVPLSPGEEVNITHREWSHTSEEFERLVTDYLEEFSEEGVTEKSELAESVNSQSQHASAFNTGVTASGSYGGMVTITSTVGYNASESASLSAQNSRNQSADITHKASSRAKREHKISFRVASASEVEDQTVRKLKNPYLDRATRVDYYQLLRRWQVDLYRYGIRLTWDMAIPEPGSGLLSKLGEIRSLQQELEQDFNQLFTLNAQEIGLAGYTDNLRDYTEIANDYSVAVTEPPPQPELYGEIVFDRMFEAENEQCGSGHPNLTYRFDEEIPEGYEVAGIAHASYIWERCSNHSDWAIRIKDVTEGSERYLLRYAHDVSDDDEIKVTSFDHWQGKSAKLAVWLHVWRIKYLTMTIGFKYRLRESAFRAWQQCVWQTIHDGYQVQYYEDRQKKQEKLARLQEELGAQDALSLRKKEREEVMKAMLRWLNLPDFEFFPSSVSLEPSDPEAESVDLERDLYDGATGLIQPEHGGALQVMPAHGELIKFLHHAVEWENMLYFLYPYFWCHPTRWEFKKYLEHPDPMHRAFLKAGSARVVLTIRPGFEEAFLAFMNTGELELLPPSPYFSIAKEFEAYAQTNYPGIPAANPVSSARPLMSRQQNKAWEQMQHIMTHLEEYRWWHYPTQSQAWDDIRLLMQFLEAYRAESGAHRYPSDLAELANQYPEESWLQELKDPWGQPYVYQHDAANDSYSLLSHGADGQVGGEDEDKDIIAMRAPQPCRSYPATLDALAQHFSYKNDPILNNPVDPWGEHQYQYTFPGVHAEYDLVCLGADGAAGGEEEDADITSWAEASHVGRWYEYTPTSALDIAFDETLPPR